MQLEQKRRSSMAGLRIHSVLVTGANRGIGLGLVQHFLGMPAPPQWVFAACRDPTGQRAQELQHLASKHRNLVIIQLGMVIFSALDDETLENMTKVYTTNTIGPLLMGQAFLPLLKKAAQGSPGSALSCSRAAIINMSSSGGSIVEVTLFDMAQLISYRCSKVCPVVNMGPDFCSQQTTVKPSVSPPSIPAPLHLVTEAALNMLTKCQSLRYKEDGVLCVALHPGWVQTDLGDIGDTGSQKPPLTVDESVQGMLKVLSSLSEKDTGTFLSWEGKVIPW